MSCCPVMFPILSLDVSAIPFWGWLAVFSLCGLFSGALFTWLLFRPHHARMMERLDSCKREQESSRNRLIEKEAQISDLTQTMVRLETLLEHEREASQQKADFLDDSEQKLSHVFQALSNEALQNNSQTFLTLAGSVLDKYHTEARSSLQQKETAVENLVGPLKETLRRVTYQVDELEKARLHAYGSLSEQIKSLIGTHEKLQMETGNLVKALRAPTVRGRWGEIQLKRVVEIAGMVEHCDFVQQQSVTTDSGRLRPDLIVQMPGGKNIVVDAKSPLQAYLEATEATEESLRLCKLKEHAQQIRTHMANLSAKSYWEQFQPTPEFVVLFLPGESFFSAALEQDPSLIEEGVSQHIILATPTTLISLLRTVHYGWRQEKIAHNAQNISELGQQLHERVATMVEHLSKIGFSLAKSVESFNAAVASFEGRVLPTARKFKLLGAGSKKEIEEMPPIDKQVRSIVVPEDPGVEQAPFEQTSFPFDTEGQT